MRRCYGCMREYDKQFDVCPYCGYIAHKGPESRCHLAPGTKLAGRYILGKALGHGGFGITYIAWDGKINKAVAIKEYFPNAFSTRGFGESEVSCYNSKAEKFLKQGVEKMLDEARRVSKFSKNENIVDIYDFFEENNTAYIVMEYLEGSDLKKYLEENGGKLDAKKAIELIQPVINALEDMHKENLIHRDISPDNIFLCDNGKVKLLDFGSARLSVENSDKSLSVMIKRGYAPREQYASHSKQGPWTDVYAVCATLYKMITGELPTESTERDEEPLKKFSEFGIRDCADLEKVIFKGLEVEYTSRIQSVSELRNALVKAMQKKSVPAVAETPKRQAVPPKAEEPVKPVVLQKPEPEKQPETKSKQFKELKSLPKLVIAAVVAVIVFGVGIAFGTNAFKSKPDTAESDVNAKHETTETVTAEKNEVVTEEIKNSETITQKTTQIVEKIIETVTEIVYIEQEVPAQETTTEKITERTTVPVVTEAVTIPAVKWEKAVDSGYCGGGLTWTLYEDGELIIKGNGYMYDWFMSTTPSPWYNHDVKVKSVIIGKGVRSIGDSAFYQCNQLERISFESGIHLERIGENAFYNCRKLKSIAIPDTVRYIDGYAFSMCQSLERLSIPEGVEVMSIGMIMYCYNLRSVDIPVSVTKIDANMFFLCNKLTDIYYSGTKEQWNQIEINEMNDDWKDTVTVHYNS